MNVNDLYSINNNTSYFDSSDTCDPTAPSSNPSNTSSSLAPTSLPASASIDQKIGQTLILGFDAGTDKGVIQDLFKKYSIGGMYLTGTSDAAKAGFTKDFYSTLSQDAGVQITATSDEEGVVTRYTYAPGVAKPAAQMGTTAETTGSQMAQGMTDNGIGVDLAPVLDLRDVGTGLTGRSFSSDPSVVTAQAGAFASGLQSGGITPVFKHFPGFDSTTTGTTDDVNGAASIIHMKGSIDSVVSPYKALTQKYPNAGVMLSNMYIDVVDPTQPASTSPKMVSYLRNTVGFKGMVTTDDLSVHAVTNAVGGSLAAAVSKSLQAGVTMPLFKAPGTDSIANAEAAMNAIIAKVKGAVDATTVGQADTLTAAFKAATASKSPSPQASSNASCCSSSSTTLTGNTDTARAFNYFTGKGLTSAQAAGILGNLAAESGIQPERLQSTPSGVKTPAETLSQSQLSDTSLGWGIAQFTPPGKLINPTKTANKDPNDIAVQLDFLWNQLQTNESAALAALKTTDTPEDAATSFEAKYERPASLADAPTRDALARAIYVQVTGGGSLPPTAGAITTPSTSCGGSSGGSSDISAYKNPYRGLKDLQPDRIDGGVDVNGDGPIYAIGNGKIVFMESNGPDDPAHWYTTYIEYKLSDGPAAGKYVYFAEHCPPASGITQGASVTPDTVICNMPADHSSTKGGTGAFSESGWGNASFSASSYVEGSDYSQHTNDNGNWASNGGVNFSQLLIKLGGPHGVVADGPSTVPLPGNFPTWQ